MALRTSVLIILAIATQGCVSSDPGMVGASTGNPIVTIGAGVSEIGGGNGWRVWYVIDTATHTCWMKLGDSAGALSCCSLLSVKEARQYLSWVDKNSCSPSELRRLTPGMSSTPTTTTPEVPNDD